MEQTYRRSVENRLLDVCGRPILLDEHTIEVACPIRGLQQFSVDSFSAVAPARARLASCGGISPGAVSDSNYHFCRHQITICRRLTNSPSRLKSIQLVDQWRRVLHYDLVLGRVSPAHIQALTCHLPHLVLRPFLTKSGVPTSPTGK